MARKVFVVLNPVAGDGAAGEVRAALSRTHAECGWELTYYETTGEENVGDVVVDALSSEQYVAVYAAGGDGTVSEVADGLSNREMPLGIIPTGTANVLARELNIPADIVDACRFLANAASTRPVDAIELNGRYGVLNVSVGLVADVMDSTSRAEKQQLGLFAYVRNGIKRLWHGDSQQFTLVVDGERIDVRATEIALANVSTVGALKAEWGPHIAPDNGHVDVSVIRGRMPLDFLIIAFDMILRRQRQDPRINYYVVHQRAEIHTTHQAAVQMDGEPAGMAPIEVTIHPAAVDIFAPSDGETDNVTEAGAAR